MKSNYKWQKSRAAFQTLKMLYVAEQPLSASAIAQVLKFDRTTIAHHIDLFRQQGLIDTQKDGKWRLFSVDKEQLKKRIKKSRLPAINDLIKGSKNYEELITSKNREVPKRFVHDRKGHTTVGGLVLKEIENFILQSKETHELETHIRKIVSRNRELGLENKKLKAELKRLRAKN